jgi:uncharacterized membrane protein required for colicin V production
MADMTAQALKTVNLVTQELETQSLNSIVAGFSFAAAMSWMDLVRWLIQQLIKMPRNGGTQYTLTAILTTLLSIAVYMVISQHLQPCLQASATSLRDSLAKFWASTHE